MFVICKLASAPLPWVQWLSGKSVRLAIGRSRVRFPAGSLWIFLSLSKLTSTYSMWLSSKRIALKVGSSILASGL